MVNVYDQLIAYHPFCMYEK